MTKLDRLYVQLLNFGLVLMREAFYSQDREWERAQIEFLHNVPSLIGEQNYHRHEYFWNVEREMYFEWLAKSGSADAKSGTATYYQPVLDELRPIVGTLAIAASPPAHGRKGKDNVE